MNALKLFFCAASTGAAGIATQSAAHPHLFVDAEIELVMDGTGLVEINMIWIYDEFFSLLLTEDFGLDSDLDGTLTEAERLILADNVLEWPPGFEGDLYLTQNGNSVSVGPRSAMDVQFENGQMIETHTRPVGISLDQPLTIKVYDPSYYGAYTVKDVRIIGREDCQASISRADIIAATERVDELLYALPQDQAEGAFPMVGEDFADTVSVTCAG